MFATIDASRPLLPSPRTRSGPRTESSPSTAATVFAHEA
jgi:hypothetical protein